MVTPEFAYGESPLSSPQQAGGYPAEALYERIYQAVRVYGYTLKEVADALGLYYSTVSVIAKRVAEAKKHQE